MTNNETEANNNSIEEEEEAVVESTAKTSCECYSCKVEFTCSIHEEEVVENIVKGWKIATRDENKVMEVTKYQLVKEITNAKEGVDRTLQQLASELKPFLANENDEVQIECISMDEAKRMSGMKKDDGEEADDNDSSKRMECCENCFHYFSCCGCCCNLC